MIKTQKSFIPVLEKREIRDQRVKIQKTFIEEYSCGSCKQGNIDPVKLNCRHRVCLQCAIHFIIYEVNSCPWCNSIFRYSITYLQQYIDTDYYSSLIERHPGTLSSLENTIPIRYIPLYITYGNNWYRMIRGREYTVSPDNMVKVFLDTKSRYSFKRIFKDDIKRYANKYETELSKLLLDKLLIKQVNFQMSTSFNETLKGTKFEVNKALWGKLPVKITIEWSDFLKMSNTIINFEMDFSMKGYQETILKVFDKEVIFKYLKNNINDVLNNET